MTNNKQLQLALEIATMAHKNVQRRNGDPYIFHVLRVANNATYIRTKTQKAAGIPLQALYNRSWSQTSDRCDVTNWLLLHRLK